MNVRKDSIETVSEKLNHTTTVLLKKWAGLSGFYGYKAMSFDEVLALLNTNGWRVNIDDSVAHNRVVELFHTPQPKVVVVDEDEEEVEVQKVVEKPVEKKVRREKFAIDEAGKVRKL